MQVTVTFRHMDSTEALRSYAEEKSERFAKYLVEPVEVHWFLSVEKIRHIAEATIAAKDVSIKACEVAEDMYSAIDMALEKLEKQVRKHKEKIKNHKLGDTEAAMYPPADVYKGEPQLPRIIETENMFVKPMSVEEATLQLGVSKGNFLVFTDSATGRINVLYRRGDGNFGLIEARVK